MAATNPMQRKSRNALIIGLMLGLLVAALIGVLAYMKIQDQQEELKKYQKTQKTVSVLNQEVKPGQVLMPEMFSTIKVSTLATNFVSTDQVDQLLSSGEFCTSTGVPIKFHYAEGTSIVDYYYIVEDKNEYQIYSKEDNEVATELVINKEFYYKKDNNNVYIKISSNAVVAKIKLSANTIVTADMITRADGFVTRDLRKTEYNIISLPIDLTTDDYIDVRLMLPSGENYIVLAKKIVKIPVANGAYLADAVQLDLREDEILTLSGAIVECAGIEGAYLYATKYKEPGIQTAATVTYYPSNNIINLINTDPNIVTRAINDINIETQKIRDAINNAKNQYGDEDNVKSTIQKGISTTLKERQQYLQSLPAPLE